MSFFTTVWITLGALGLSVLAVQWLAVRRHLRAPAPVPDRNPAISILKPLCGVDDDLLSNIECFATLPYPDFEVLLGVKDTRDAAWPVARAAAERWPARVRVLVQL